MKQSKCEIKDIPISELNQGKILSQAILNMKN